MWKNKIRRLDGGERALLTRYKKGFILLVDRKCWEYIIFTCSVDKLSTQQVNPGCLKMKKTLV